MSSDSKRLKIFLVKISLFSGLLPLCVSFLFLYFIIRFSQDKIATYHQHEIEKIEFTINKILIRGLDSLNKITVSDELKNLLKSNFHTELDAKKNLQSLFGKERSFLNQNIFYCIYGAYGSVLYAEKLCPKSYDKKLNRRVILDNELIILNISHSLESDFSTELFFSAVMPVESITQNWSFLKSIDLISNSIDNIKVKVHLKPEIFDKQIDFLFYFGILISSLISLCSIIYGLKIAYSLKKKAEDSLQLATIGKMAHMLAHDIKKPFLNFTHFAQEIIFCKTQEEREKLIQLSKESIQSSQVFIEKVLNELMYSHEHQLNLEHDVALSKIIHECFETISHLDQSKINIHVDLRHTLKISVDSVKITRCFLNLISNAIEAVNDNKSVKNNTIKINSNDYGSYVRIIFYNSCKNMKPEHFKNIFEPFFTTKKHGTGLGLFITKRMIELHKGKISCRYKKSDGLYFFVDLPGIKSTKSKNVNLQICPESLSKNDYIFLIDDCPLTLRMWKRILIQKNYNCKIQEFLNFENFFDFIKSNHIHNDNIQTIICDYIFKHSTTPVEDNLETIRKFYSKKLYIATHMDTRFITKKLNRFNVVCIDKDLASFAQ